MGFVVCVHSLRQSLVAAIYLAHLSSYVDRDGATESSVRKILLEEDYFLQLIAQLD